MGLPALARDEDYLRQELDKLSERLKRLEEPTGTSAVSLVERVDKSLATVDSRIDAGVIARSYSKSDVDNKIANPGNINASGNITASGTVQGNVGRFNGGLYSNDARNFVVQSNYAASWIDINGHFGISPSTRRYKRDIEEWVGEDVEKILALRPVKYHLDIPERRILQYDEEGQVITDENGDPVIITTYPAFRDEDDAPMRTGFLAEDLIDAGLEELVVFDRDGLPASINYAEYVVVCQLALRWLNERRIEQEKELSLIRSAIINAGIPISAS